MGNPPFIGNKRMRDALEDGYVQALRSAWPEVPASADFVMFWWHKAAESLTQGKTRCGGLITTNSISQTFNRAVIQAALARGGRHAWAMPDHPWVDGVSGAQVRVAMSAIDRRTGDPGTLWKMTSEVVDTEGAFVVGLAAHAGVISAVSTSASRHWSAR